MSNKQTAVQQLFMEMLTIQQSGKVLTIDENVDLLNKYKDIEKIQQQEYYNQGFSKAKSIYLDQE